jgi:uncharacterized protein YktB (UPF0637 family)
VEDEIREMAKKLGNEELEKLTAEAAAVSQELESRLRQEQRRNEEAPRELRLAASNASRTWKALLEVLMIRKRGFAGTTVPGLV